MLGQERAEGPARAREGWRGAALLTNLDQKRADQGLRRKIESQRENRPHEERGADEPRVVTNWAMGLLRSKQSDAIIGQVQ